VTGLLFTSEGRRVTGIRTSAGLFAADLIIDATGRGSRSPSWLEAIGNGRPPEDKIEMNMAYCTRCFRRSPHHLEGASLATIPATPEHGKGGIVLAQEGDSWIVTLVAYCGGTVPTELRDYIEFAKGLPFPYIHDVISQAEPIGEAHAARISSSIRRRYERMKRFPQGYLVLGDAVCSFNPAYGQGMSVAALEACALGETLRRGSANLARRFYARIANIVDIPWSLAAGGDLRMSQVIGSRTPILRFRNWYIAKLHLAARQDSRLVLAFQRVVNLLAPPSSLLRPSVMVRVLFAVPVQVAVRQITELFLRGSLFRSLGKVRSLIHFFW